MFIYIIKIIDTFFRLFFKIDFYGFLSDRLVQRYTNIIINNKKIKFFSHNHISKWRIDTLFQKEPETISWIKKFKKQNKDFIFWDVGSNIGIYSIYSSIIHKNLKVFSFEPSFLNLGILSRNISINNLTNKVSIFQLPLSNKSNFFQAMNESSLSFAGALSTFGSKKNFEGKKTKFVNSYKILGTSLNNAIENKILKIPDYIKIDVDGLEHIILNGFDKFASDKKIKSILIEITENYITQKKFITNFMKKQNFILEKKEQSQISKLGNHKTYNYIYIKKK